MSSTVRIDYAGVAEEYQRAPDKKATKHVASVLGVPFNTAKTWVKECRRRGFLPQVKHGWVTDTKLAAVAEFLEVEPEALAEAIKVFAAGRIEV